MTDSVRTPADVELEVRAQDRATALEEISPQCVRRALHIVQEPGKADQIDEVLCGHKLNRHDPCSQCTCPGFVSAAGEDAAEASEALMAAHPELFGRGGSMDKEA